MIAFILYRKLYHYNPKKHKTTKELKMEFNNKLIINRLYILIRISLVNTAIFISMSTYAQQVIEPSPNLCTQSIENATKEIQSTLDLAASKHEKVVFKPGVYTCGTLFLPENSQIVLETGAILLASPDISDFKSKETIKNGDRQPFHFLIAWKVKNIRIEGGGIIDGNGPAFWKPERLSNWDFYKEKDKRPLPMLEFKEVDNLSITGITIQNSPGWTCHINQCKNVIIQGIKISNNLFGPNTDGIDINGSENVKITQCIIKTGDDAIVCKTTTDSKPCKDIYVSNNILETNCVAMKIGTESHFDFTNIHFSNCTVLRSSRVFGIVVLDGGKVSQVSVKNIKSNTNCGWILNRFIHINVDQRKDSSRLGSISNVVVKNFEVETDGRCLIAAKKGAILENITLDSITVKYPLIDDPFSAGKLANGDIHFFKSNEEARGARAVFVFDNVTNVELRNYQITYPTYPLNAKKWALLTCNKNWGNENYITRKEDIISGKLKPVFVPVWVNNTTLKLTKQDFDKEGFESNTSQHLYYQSLRKNKGIQIGLQ